MITTEQDTEQTSQSTSVEACAATLAQVLPRVARVFKAQMRGGPLSYPQMAMLQEIHDQALPGELARRCGLSSPAVTAAIDALVDAGFCVRTHSAEDRRKVVVRPTTAGAEALAAAQAGATEAMRELLRGWSEERTVRLLEAVRDLGEAADEYVERCAFTA